MSNVTVLIVFFKIGKSNQKNGLSIVATYIDILVRNALNNLVISDQVRQSTLAICPYVNSTKSNVGE